MADIYTAPEPMDADEVRRVARALKPTLEAQRHEANAIDSWLKPDTKRGFDLPARATNEHRQLADLARTPWLSLVVTNVAQAMFVNGIVGGDPDDNGNVDSQRLWSLWVDNGMPAHQVANHRAMVGYGQSFAVVMPAINNGVDSARIRCLSPRRMACMWNDAATDLYPEYALEALSATNKSVRYRVYDKHYVYELVDSVSAADDPGAGMALTGHTHHGFGVTPVVRFANMLDLDGNVLGEVTPFIPTAARINKTAYDRLLAQHFNSWKVRTIAGIDLPQDEDDADAEAMAVAREKMRLAQEDILISEDENTKFGTLDGTSLDTFVAAWKSDIEALAAVSQTPAHALTGQLVNLSPDALAAARAPLTNKVFERQTNAGASYSRVLRLAASAAGYDAEAADPHVRTTWQDMEIRSMSQAVDALGKAASMLKIPARGLWGRIPGVERSDVQQWETMAKADEAADPLNAVIRRHGVGAATEAGTTTEPPAEG